ncbi:hypothetical protein RJ45_14620 [Photobacterium gaetbulicola]|uniref:Uncharacterized protein n=2 Tax=Photobacterium TaxID=657 RepID=A0A0B9GW50_9GAMM|nr:hypothetical protein [Photobacterium gaetbulicola]KHT62946.1 hypothetical protein RJ45_14620 [Photobacterium gaetbulicola]
MTTLNSEIIIGGGSYMDFTQKMRLRGKAEEDLYFAQQDQALIEALHDMQESGEIENWHKSAKKESKSESQ